MLLRVLFDVCKRGKRGTFSRMKGGRLFWGKYLLPGDMKLECHFFLFDGVGKKVDPIPSPQ